MKHLRPIFLSALFALIACPAMAQDPPPVPDNAAQAAPPQAIVIKENGTEPYIDPEYKESIKDKLASAKHVTLKVTKKVKAKKGEFFTDSLGEWLNKNGFSTPTMIRTENGYTYNAKALPGRPFAYTDGIPSGEFTKLEVTDPAGKMTTYDVSSFGPHNEFPSYIHYAAIKDDILYLSIASDTFDDINPDQGFMLAISRKDGKILWRTPKLVCDAQNFLIMDDTIICGYGKTDHPSALYTINRLTGEAIKKIKLPGKSAPEYFFIKENTIRMISDDMDYTFSYK